MFEMFHSYILNVNNNDRQLKLASLYTVMSFNMDFSSLFKTLITVLQIFLPQYTLCFYIYWKH